MEVELILLGALIIIFIASFCGLVYKIRKTYERDREYTERVTNMSPSRLSFTEIYINSGLTRESEDSSTNSQGVFPSAPPPYSETYCEPPPKYEDIVMDEDFRININIPGTSRS